jgi:hypothetical protein
MIATNVDSIGRRRLALNALETNTAARQNAVKKQDPANRSFPRAMGVVA